MITHGNKGEGPQPDHHHGTAAALPQRECGGVKTKEVVSKLPNAPKDQTRDPPSKDMRYDAR